MRLIKILFYFQFIIIYTNSYHDLLEEDYRRQFYDEGVAQSKCNITSILSYNYYLIIPLICTAR